MWEIEVFRFGVAFSGLMFIIWMVKPDGNGQTHTPNKKAAWKSF
jgi:hypothetical protein